MQTDNRGLIECNGTRLKALIKSGIKRFELHKREIDAINVFPVPDGDTGKNMHNTFLAVWQSVKGADRSSAGKIAYAAATGAFQGARGCSGIIFSGLLTGFANAVKEKGVITSEDFAKGLKLAAQEAYRRLAEPKEGTILTVAKKISIAAERMCVSSVTLLDLLKGVYEEAKKALSETPQELPVLKEAGVVDAGASALAYFLEGMFMYSSGQSLDKQELKASVVKMPTVKEEVSEEYCIEFILSGRDVAVDKLMKTLTELGHSVIVNEGEGSRFKIHIHASDPKKIFDRTLRFGKPAYIKVDDLSHEQKEYLKRLKK